MAGFKNIVVCSDFSENSNKAFDMAAQVAEGEDAKLTVLHVVATTYNYEDMQAASAGGVAKVYGDRARERIQELYEGRAKMPIEIAVEYGNEAAKITSFAEEKGADLIVMGSRGVGFIVGLLGGGSVVNKVTRNATVPVLVVPA